MILNDMHERISKTEELKNSKRSGKDCGCEWVSIPKFCGKWVGTGWRKVNQEYQQQLRLCRKKTRHYCRYNKAVIYCSGCYTEHLLSISCYNEGGNELIV